MEDLKRWVNRQGIPVTLTMLALIIVGSIASWSSSWIGMMLTYGKPFPLRPWGLLTYPLPSGSLSSATGILFFIFTLMWIYWMGGSVEREQTTARTVAIWLFAILAPALLVAPLRVQLVGAFVPVSTLLVIWATRSPNQLILLFGIVPIKAWWLAAFDAAVIFFTMNGGNIIASFLLMIPLAVAYLFASNRLPFLPYRDWSATKPRKSKAQKLREEAYFDDVAARSKEREERERLRKLFEGSLGDDPEAGRR